MFQLVLVGMRVIILGIYGTVNVFYQTHHITLVYFQEEKEGLLYKCNNLCFFSSFLGVKFYSHAERFCLKNHELWCSDGVSTICYRDIVVCRRFFLNWMW